ncbi:MAG: branched-chain amino acid ABC transporter permease [Clostridiales bacterium]|nr:branched-chain amino acid ABC transporter permease [Clostridiales bacterium]
MQQVVNGLAQGGIYSLIAIGWTTVYGVVGVMNWTHGEVYMLGGFSGFFLFTRLKLPFLPGLLIAMAVGSALAMAIDQFGYKPLRKIGMPRMAGFITALGLSTLLRYSATAGFSPDPQAYPGDLLDYRMITLFRAGGREITVSSLHLFIFLGTLAIMLALELFIRRTLTGKAMLAASQDMSTLELMGADPEKLIKITFAISGALGAAAGVFVGTIYAINTMMGSLAGLKGWSVAILGGVGNMTGSMLGGLLLGIAESLTAGFISTGYKDAIGFIIMILVLLIKPTGLMGYSTEEKV